VWNAGKAGRAHERLLGGLSFPAQSTPGNSAGPEVGEAGGDGGAPGRIAGASAGLGVPRRGHAAGDDVMGSDDGDAPDYGAGPTFQETLEQALSFGADFHAFARRHAGESPPTSPR